MGNIWEAKWDLDTDSSWREKKKSLSRMTLRFFGLCNGFDWLIETFIHLQIGTEYLDHSRLSFTEVRRAAGGYSLHLQHHPDGHVGSRDLEVLGLQMRMVISFWGCICLWVVIEAPG